jgi:hypothetical protein
MTTQTSKNLSITRGLVYALGLAASALSLAGLADFNVVSGAFDLRPFNLYAVGGAVAGSVTSALALIAVMFRWGK